MNSDWFLGNLRLLKALLQRGSAQLAGDSAARAAAEREFLAGRLQRAYGIGRAKAVRVRRQMIPRRIARPAHATEHDAPLQHDGGA